MEIVLSILILRILGNILRGCGMRLNLLKWMEMGDKEIYKFIDFFRKIYFNEFDFIL